MRGLADHRHVARITCLLMGLVIVVEGMVAFHLWQAHEALAGVIVVTSWFREFGEILVERVLFAEM